MGKELGEGSLAGRPKRQVNDLRVGGDTWGGLAQGVTSTAEL